MFVGVHHAIKQVPHDPAQHPPVLIRWIHIRAGDGVEASEGRDETGVVVMIRVKATWQPGYMGERIPRKQIDFKTLIEAEPTIDKWNKTACEVVVSEFSEIIIEKYVWGNQKYPRASNRIPPCAGCTEDADCPDCVEHQ
jgi:hypothetical protein